MPLNPNHAATLAIRARDPDALATAFPSLDAASDYRTNTLPLLSADECRWFWQQIMSPEQFNQTLEMCMAVCRRILNEYEFQDGIHYRWHLTGDVCLLVAHVGVIESILMRRIPKERHSLLKCFFYEEP